MAAGSSHVLACALAALAAVAGGCDADAAGPGGGAAPDTGRLPPDPADAAVGSPAADSAGPPPDGSGEPADAGSPDAGPPPLTAAARFLVTVRTPGWDVPDGVLTRWRRDGGGWLRDGDDVPVVLGRSGLGWGRGLHGEGAVEGFPGPEKREGDKRSPAGAFWLDHALGYAPEPPAGTRVPYEAMTPTLQCIEDVGSAYYNRIVDRALVTPDWDSTDLLLRMDGLYELIVLVRHNTDPAPIPGYGSCILLHVWTADRATTAGCTSMALESLAEVVRSLEPDGNLLVQLPDEAYEGLADAWGLPSVTP